MNLERLYKILNETTFEFRKGEEVETKNVGILQRTDIYLMPHVDEIPKDLERVDVVLEIIAVDTIAAAKYKDELIDILKTYPNQERLIGGPSYIEVGGVIGSQSGAFQLFALGKVLGLWKLITPYTIGITGADAFDLAINGFIMIVGFDWLLDEKQTIEC